MPQSLDHGKVKNLGALASKMGYSSGDLALQKVEALLFILDFNIIDMDKVKKVVNNVAGEDVYNPENLRDAIDCIVHMKIVTDIDNARKTAMESLED